MRLGLLGGSFNPVHLGHLLLAETAREAQCLDQVWFVPAASPPHKHPQSLVEARHRVTMLKLAIGGHPALQVSGIELDRGGVSYTVDTLAELQRQQPGRELLLILGADSLVELPNWRDPGRICELATLVVAHRMGEEVQFDCLARFVSAERRRLFFQHQIEMPRIDLSSTDIRARVASGKSIRYRVPRAVEEYIYANQLYQLADTPSAPRPEGPCAFSQRQ